jgi:hypothetical protein
MNFEKLQKQLDLELVGKYNEIVERETNKIKDNLIKNMEM